jgi:uncharacterized protein (TIGR00369 family)
MTPDEMLAVAQNIMASQPFSVMLAAKIVAFSPGYAEIHLPIKPEFLQQFGYVHGGVLGYLADNALTFAGGSVFGAEVITSEFKINYVKPAKGSLLIARATVAITGSRQAVCRCDIVAQDNGQEYLCAIAQGTIVKRGE